ncbi:MAG: hypothetical protein SGI97_06865 [candidate division Zixibacteria bacterium]|nr:hypothetical protein [candidate division Zixibacteria bacterium]
MNYIGITLEKGIIVMAREDDRGSRGIARRFSCRSTELIISAFEKMRPFVAAVEDCPENRWVRNLLSPLGKIIVADSRQWPVSPIASNDIEPTNAVTLASLLRNQTISRKKVECIISGDQGIGKNSPRSTPSDNSEEVNPGMIAPSSAVVSTPLHWLDVSPTQRPEAQTSETSRQTSREPRSIVLPTISELAETKAMTTISLSLPALDRQNDQMPIEQYWSLYESQG